MSKPKEHKHSSDHHGHQNAAHHSGAKTKRIHHDWRFWTAIVLMGVAMAAYVLSFDESLQPGGVDQAEVPMSAE